MAYLFLRRFASENDSSAKTFSKDALKFIVDNCWRGNVRELENSIERAVVLCAGPEIALEDFLPKAVRLETKPVGESNDGRHFGVNYTNELPTLDEVIFQYIEFAVGKNGGARDKTAKALGIDRKTLYKRMRHEIFPTAIPV